MFVLVVGGGKVGYYLTRELIGSNHEVVLMEKDRARANQIADEIGSVVIPHDGCEVHVHKVHIPSQLEKCLVKAGGSLLLSLPVVCELSKDHAGHYVKR